MHTHTHTHTLTKRGVERGGDQKILSRYKGYLSVMRNILKPLNAT